MLPDVDKKPEKPLMIKMAGYLEKKSRMRVVGVRRWKKRWCVLEGKLLLYFKTQLEYSHHLSPCRGSVNMGLVLSVTLRGPCQLQIVTRSQIIILRTKSKPEQDNWFAALRDACSSNNLQQTLVKRRERQKSTAANTEGNRNRMFNGNCRTSAAAAAAAATATAEPRSRPPDRKIRGGGRPRLRRESFGDAFFEAAAKRNGFRGIAADCRSSVAALRKSESDNRISFYRELHGLVRTDALTAAAAAAAAAVNGDKDQQLSGCRSRSLSYESVYFKPQESGSPQPAEAAKSRSCRELGPAAPDVAATRDANASGFGSKAMSRSETFFQRRRENSDDSDDYDYVEVAKLKYSAPTAHAEESEQPPRPEQSRVADTSRASPSATIAARSDSDDGDGDGREANVDVVYVNSDRKTMAELVLEYGAGRTADEPEDEPPPLPVKAKKKKTFGGGGGERRPDDGAQTMRRQTADGRCVYVHRDGADEVIYDVPIPHGKLIEHFRRLTVQAPSSSVKRYADNAVYDDSLEQSLYGTLHMAPDSLEIASLFPAYKRWSNDSGFNNCYEDSCHTLSPDQTHFEDSLEPVIAMMHRDRKIWQNVPNINSTDYFR